MTKLDALKQRCIDDFIKKLAQPDDKKVTIEVLQNSTYNEMNFEPEESKSKT